MRVQKRASKTRVDALVPAHPRLLQESKTWVAGTSPAMTTSSFATRAKSQLRCLVNLKTISLGPLCHTLSRSDLHVSRSNELKRDLSRPAPFQQVLDRAGQLLVKRNRAFRFDVKTRQVAVLDVPDLCLGIPCGLDRDASHLAAPVFKQFKLGGMLLAYCHRIVVSLLRCIGQLLPHHVIRCDTQSRLLCRPEGTPA